jgi:hypothetical protein
VIALPPNAKVYKIATPKEVAASRGVWPISSGGNVMVIVKDTATFIQAARERHGDKYDYSQTVYAGSQKPITIGCIKCGPVTLSQAGSHYRKRKACGCRRCERMEGELRRKGNRALCKGCGEQSLYRLNGFCRSCRESGVSQQEARKKATYEKYKRNCDCCGIEYSDRNRPKFCSDKCRNNMYPIRVIQCDVCGCEVTRKEYTSQKAFKVRVCGKKCQTAYRVRLSHISQKQNIDWVARSLRAKKRWKAKHRSQRMKRESWFRVFNRLSRVDYKPAEKAWIDKFRSMVQCNKYREVLSVSRVEKVSEPSSRKAHSVFRSLSKQLCKKGVMTWGKKMLGIVSNQRKRMKRISLREV